MLLRLFVCTGLWWRPSCQCKHYRKRQCGFAKLVVVDNDVKRIAVRCQPGLHGEAECDINPALARGLHVPLLSMRLTA